jgi:hypothetical protein
MSRLPPSYLAAIDRVQNGGPFVCVCVGGGVFLGVSEQLDILLIRPASRICLRAFSLLSPDFEASGDEHHLGTGASERGQAGPLRPRSGVSPSPVASMARPYSLKFIVLILVSRHVLEAGAS